MCGIFAYLGKTYKLSDLRKHFQKIQSRGPDNSVIEFVDQQVCFGFHRLSINDVSTKGNQPLYKNNLILICNGEIYNHSQLIKDNNFKTFSNSDCEVILHLYQRFGIRDTINYLDGVFSFVLYDGDKDIIYAARDPFGVRPMFIGFHNDEILFASEMKAISDLSTEIKPFPPGVYWDSQTQKFSRYYFDTTMVKEFPQKNMELICSNVK